MTIQHELTKTAGMFLAAATAVYVLVNILETLARLH